MDEIAKIRAAKDFLTVKAKEFMPAELTRQGQEGDVVRAVFFLLAANEMDREVAASFLHDWVTSEREYNYTFGMLHGYAIGEGLSKAEKKKLQHKTIVKTLKALRKLEKRKPEFKAKAQVAKDFAKLKKRKLDHKSKILRVLMKNPEARPNQIALALDNAEIERPDVKSLRNYERGWENIVETRYFKNLIRRAREQVAKARLIRNWRARIKEIKIGAGILESGAGILDFDFPR